MNDRNGSDVGPLRWRRFIVDLLIVCATLAVGAAAINPTADIIYVLSLLGALVGIGLILEPHVTVRPFSESDLALTGLMTTGFDTTIVDAASPQ